MNLRAPSTSLAALAATTAFGALAPALVASESAFAQSEPPKAEDTFEFAGYYRLGYNTAINPLEEAPDEQGFGPFGLPTSRHVRNPNYLKLITKKSFANGMKFQLQLDTDGDRILAHETGFKPQVETTRNANGQIDDVTASFGFLRVRDAYLSLPVTDDISLWAGSRLQEFEDLRLFDGHNPFDVNAFGGGLESKDWLATLSYQKSERTRDSAIAPTSPAADRNTAEVKDVTLLLRYSLALSEGSAIKPMLKITRFGSASEDKSTSPTVRKVKGSTGVAIGGTYSRWDGKTYWGNTTLAFLSGPAEELIQSNVGTSYSTARTITGEKSGNDNAIYVADTSSVDFGAAGILTGIYLRYNMFKNDHQVFKEQSGAIVPDGTKKEKNNLEYSVGLQPVYYVTDRFHTALDLNYAGRTEKFAADQADALLVTPILRYAMNRNPLGTPQIYTSITYGKYDAKVKRDDTKKPTDELLTTQTGFEVWF